MDAKKYRTVHVETATKKSFLDGTPFMDPFNNIKHLFKWNQLKERILKMS